MQVTWTASTEKCLPAGKEHRIVRHGSRMLRDPPRSRVDHGARDWLFEAVLQLISRGQDQSDMKQSLLSASRAVAVGTAIFDGCIRGGFRLYAASDRPCQRRWYGVQDHGRMVREELMCR